MALPKEKIYYSPEDYLRMERVAESKHEYINGYVYAMAGESPNHGRIKMDAATVLNIRLRSKSCETFTSDMKVRTPGLNIFGYPDVLVVCGKLVFHDQFKDVILNPKAIIEVLSPSTEIYDRGEKFASYRQLESLTDYILIAQDKVRVEHFVRHGKFWLLAEETDLTQSIYIESIDCRLSLQEIYARVEFPVKDASPESPD